MAADEEVFVEVVEESGSGGAVGAVAEAGAVPASGAAGGRFGGDRSEGGGAGLGEVVEGVDGDVEAHR